MKKVLSDKEIDLVHRFMDFELTEPELASFQHRLETDDAFHQGVQKYQKAYLLTEFLDEEGSTPPIPSRNQPHTSKASKKSPFLKVVLALIIILSLLAVAGYFVLDLQGYKSTEKVYANVENYVDNMSNSITRGGSANLASPLELTIEQIKSLDNDKGVQANELENLLKETTDTDAQEVIHWWLVKVHLKNKDISSAKTILNIIRSNSNYNSSKKAQEILKEL